MMLRSLQDRIATVSERLENMHSDLQSLIAGFAELTDDDIAIFLDGAHPDLVNQLDQEMREEFLGGPGETLLLMERRPACEHLRERLRQAGRAKVLETLRRGDFRELLPAAQGESQLDPRYLKACLESAAPRLTGCGGSRRLWFVVRLRLLERPASSGTRTWDRAAAFGSR